MSIALLPWKGSPAVVALVLTGVALGLPSPMHGQEARDAGVTVGQATATAVLDDGDGPPAAAAPDAYERGYQGAPQLSDAERIAHLQRKIEQDSAKLQDFRARIEDPSGEYAEAEAEFRRLDAERQALEERLQERNDAGDAEAARGVEDQLATQEKTWKLAKERFDLAITERKILQEQITSIESSLAESREALAELSGEAEPPAEPAPETPTVGQAPPDATPPVAPPEGSPAPTEPPAESPPAPEAPAAPEPAAPALADPASVLTGALTGSTQPAGDGGAGQDPPKAQAKPEEDEKVSEEVRKARQAAQEKAEAAERARSEAEEIDQQIARLEHRIALEQKQLETCRRRADNASDTCSALEEQFREQTVAGASEQELRALMGQIQEAEQRFSQARLASRAQVDRLVELQNEHSQLLSEQLRARKEAEETLREYQAAQGYLEELQNPLNPRNMIQWVVDRGPRIVALVLAMLVFRWFMRLTSRRVVPLIASRGARGSREEREARARTLVGVFENFASVVILVGGTLMVLETCGIPVMPLLGGAAVVGLAVAFGAQNLVRDYFYGFMILLENQYKINDVVRLGEVAGQVEQITLRMTVLRDLEGSVHFVPNGSIQRVTNMTHGWSRALFELTIAYKEDADRVMAICLDVGKELRNDPAFRLLILEDPTMLGVDAFAESGVTVKFFIKTRTLKQWDVKREMLRRLKRRFDELGIDIALPHRVVYHRSPEAEDQALRAIAEPQIFAPKARI